MITTLNSQNRNFCKVVDFFIVISSFVFYLAWSLRVPVELCPDEYGGDGTGRFALPLWILKNNKLPMGDEPELISPVWGFSYAFNPYLPSLIAVLFMKFIGIFTTDLQVLLHAARLVSVLSGSGTVLICLLIGRELFKRGTIIFFAILVGFLPQFAFLSSYLNNDCFSVFCSALILLAWVKGLKTHWNIKSCVLLGVGISLESLAYYFAYGWILCSIILAFVSVFFDATIDKKLKFFLKRLALVFGIFAVLAGWYFIRNAIIYDGDFFGRRALTTCAELHAADAYKPSLHHTYKLEGNSFISILSDFCWHRLTLKSFICGLGYMNIFAKKYIYVIYVMFIILGIFLLVCKVPLVKTKKSVFPMPFYTSLIFCIIIPYFISMYYSWATDYQPQGRYVISSLIPIMLFVAFGYDFLVDKLFLKTKKNIMPVFISVYIGLFLVVLFTVIIPKCFGETFISKLMPNVKVIEKDEKMDSLKIELSNVGKYESLRIAVWSAIDAQDDLYWFELQDVKDRKGSFYYDIPLDNYTTNGTYWIHVYGVKKGKQKFLASTDTEIQFD